jgi:hypothetical protein
MKIKFLKGTMAERKPRKEGEIGEVNDKEAQFLIAIKRAEKHEGEEENQEAEEQSHPEELVLAEDDLKPKSKKKKNETKAEPSSGKA